MSARRKLALDRFTRVMLMDCVRELEAALDGMTTMYVEFVNSGDGGIWNPEQDKEVIAARKALAAARSPSGEGQP